MKSVFTFVFLISISEVLTTLVGDKYGPDPCSSLESCSSCLKKSYCSWCINKSHCTKHSCGNDNVIYPDTVSALMTGEKFCPRIVQSDRIITYQAGVQEKIKVQLTQMYIYMAFTSWKCRIKVGDEETLVNARLVVDIVFCDDYNFTTKSDSPYVDGSVTVVWDHMNQFDGVLPFKVCQCNLEPSCIACRKKQ